MTGCTGSIETQLYIELYVCVYLPCTTCQVLKRQKYKQKRNDKFQVSIIQ